MHYVGFVENSDVVFTFVFPEKIVVFSSDDKFFWDGYTEYAIVARRRLTLKLFVSFNIIVQKHGKDILNKNRPYFVRELLFCAFIVRFEDYCVFTRFYLIEVESITRRSDGCCVHYLFIKYKRINDVTIASRMVVITCFIRPVGIRFGEH